MTAKVNVNLIVAIQRSIQENKTQEYLIARRVREKKVSKMKILYLVEDNQAEDDQVDVTMRMMKVMRGINSMILRDHIVKRVQEI